MGYSRASRLRFMRRVAQFDQEALFDYGLLFATLTYPAEFPTPRVAADHFEAFREALRRKYPELSGLWKREPQKRGAVHFHLLLCWPGLARQGELGWEAEDLEERAGKLDTFQGWLADTWFRIAGGGDYRHWEFHRYGDRRRAARGEGNGVVELVKSWDQLQRYASKYAGKPVDLPEVIAEGWDYPGRWWGTINRRGVAKFARAVVYSLPPEIYRYIRRVYARRLPKGLQRKAFVRGDTGRLTTYDRKAWFGHRSMLETLLDYLGRLSIKITGWYPGQFL